MKQVHFTTPQIDAAIIKLYRSQCRRGAVSTFARSIGRPRWWVSHRALLIAAVAPRTRTDKWTQPELDILERNHWRHLKTIRASLLKAGFRRSVTAISMRRHLEGHKLFDSPYMTATGLAALTGVDPQTVMRVWIGKEGLKATRRGTLRTPEQGDHHWISVKAFRRWLRTNHFRVDLRRVNATWFWEYVVHGDSRA